MARTSPAPTPSIPAAVVQVPGASPLGLLDSALLAAGFWELLRRRRASRRRRKADLAIAIKPDLDVFDLGRPTGTDPVLVEHLVARLRAEGYRNVVVCDGRNRPDGWLHNRDALCIPDLVGYTFEAPAGDPYEVTWVEDEPVGVLLARGDDGTSLRVTGAWARADVRISFARARGDREWGFSLAAANLLGLVDPGCPASRWAPEDRVLHLLRQVPPHMALIDAVQAVPCTGAGDMGEPLETRTVIASPHTLLADWVGALKMAADPHTSPLNARALEQIRLPEAWTLVGDTTPWPGWTHPSPLLLEQVRGWSRWPELEALARAVLQPVDREAFPFRDLLLDQVSGTLLSRLDAVTEPRLREGVMTLLASALAWVAGARDAFAGNVTKGSVRRSVAPPTLDVDALSPMEFDGTPALVEAQARVLAGTPEDARGFRFRTIGGHIHFGASRILPIRYDPFVERVDISASIRYMNDYVGGAWIVVSRDSRGRPIRQAERNLYLPQPNWVGIFGGEPIDVEKVERITWEPDRQTIHWRTLHSPNGSADSDDGLVSFIRTPLDEVEVRIFARQRFRLPSAVASLRVERWPAVHGELAADAYARYFDGTLANLRAAYEGRPFRIGRDPAAAGDPSELRAIVSGAVVLVSRILGWAPPAGMDEPSAASGPTPPLMVDELGFAHFPGASVPMVVTARGEPGHHLAEAGEPLTPMTFLKELGQAVGRDLRAAGMPGIPLP